MVLTRTRLLVTAIFIAALSWLAPVVEGAEQPIRPSLNLKFSNIGTWSTHSVDIDPGTVITNVDKDGDTHVGAIARISSNSPITLDSGKQAYTFINSVIAVCGYDAVVLVASTAYDIKGNLINQSAETVAIIDYKQNSAPPTEIYRHLCKNVKVPKSVAPVPMPEPRNNPQRGNNWT